MGKKILKRSCDIIFSLFAILLLTPFWLIIILLIFLENPGPVFFTQKRVGIKGKLFTLYKFRSMRVNNIPPLELGAVKHNHLLVTKVGYILRRFKMDETPQFINIIIGNMSLVGPRPCLPERLAMMTKKEMQRFECLPGLTGWAEVNGNVELDWSEQMLLDLWYVSHWTNYLDLKIMFKTLYVVLRGSHKNWEALNMAERFLSLN